MGVIINDFEVMLEPPPAPTDSAPGTPAAAAPSAPLAPQDMVDVIRHQGERQARIRAH